MQDPIQKNSDLVQHLLDYPLWLKDLARLQWMHTCVSIQICVIDYNQI